MPHQNMPLWHKDCVLSSLIWETAEKLIKQNKSQLFCKGNLRLQKKFTLERGPVPGRADTWHLRDLPAGQGNLWFPNIDSPHLPIIVSPSSPPKDKTPFLSSGWHISLNCLAAFNLTSLWGSRRYVHVYFKWSIFSPYLSQRGWGVGLSQAPWRVQRRWLLLPCNGQGP